MYKNLSGSSTYDVQDYVVCNFLDSPSTTSSATYKLQGLTLDGSNATLLLKIIGDSNGHPRGTSTITVMEVSG